MAGFDDGPQGCPGTARPDSNIFNELISFPT